MAVDRLLALLSEHSVRVMLLVAIVSGLVAWLAASAESDPVKALHGTCAELQLTVRAIKIEPGSDQESRFLLMVPGRQRVKLPDGLWVFCRANLAIRPR
jgi:hypothetical protein